MVDYYLCRGFNLPIDTKRIYPKFEDNIQTIKEIFCQNNLKIGKTIVLAPYSTGLKGYSPPNSFWTTIAEKLIESGYSVCTNCGKDEVAIKGTCPLFVPYKKIVPFLELAGGFVGIRSGLCDIIAGTKCKKIVVHLYKAQYWPDGNSIAYTGLNNMGLCDDAYELTYERNKQNLQIQEIVSYFYDERIWGDADN